MREQAGSGYSGCDGVQVVPRLSVLIELAQWLGSLTTRNSRNHPGCDSKRMVKWGIPDKEALQGEAKPRIAGDVAALDPSRIISPGG
jgi:hypothetical protein